MWSLGQLMGALVSWLKNEQKMAAQPAPADPLAANRARAVQRARLIAAGTSRYKLGAGGRSPLAMTPFTDRDGVLGCDCVGFTCWCLGHDRYQPKTFHYYDGWINTDSLMSDARGKQDWYEPARKPEPGDVVVFPSIVRNGERVRIGHIALVTSVPGDVPDDVYSLPDLERRRWLLKVGVIDCAGALSRRLHNRAVAETTAAASWDKPDAMFARCKRAP
jgi:CHAP domain-containing protein